MNIDYLQRSQDLNNLIMVIHNLSQMKTGSTFAINGQWGSGKTFLLDLLEEKLNPSSLESSDNSNYFIVHYDCWKNNFYPEPVIPMLSSVIEALGSNDTDVIAGLLKTVKDAGSNYIGQMLKNTIGFNPVKIIDTFDEQVKKQQAATFAFDDILELKKALGQIRDSLKKLAETKTILFIVDELDRCLPEYSIRVLENIHHIFSGIDNFITLLAIDRNELTQVIKTAYGPGIDASAYLKKIIDFYVQLDLGNPSSDYSDKYSDFFNRFSGSPDAIKWCHIIIPSLVANLDIRTQEKIWKKAELIHSMITPDVLDCSCLVYELASLIQDYWHNLPVVSSAETDFQHTFDSLLKVYTTTTTEFYYKGKTYYELSDHLAARIIWYREGLKISQTSSATIHLEKYSLRTKYACSYADSIQKEDELMQKFSQLLRIIE